MSTDFVLSIDLGSSWCKAAYVDRRGTIVADGRVSTRAIVENGDIRLEDFWHALTAAVRLANQQLPPDTFPSAIGLSSRGLFGVCIDHNGTGFIPPYDILSTKSSSDVAAAYRSDEWSDEDPYAFGYAVRVAGLLAGLRMTDPIVWRQIWRVGSLHDYIVYRLSGKWVTDPASGPNTLHWPTGLRKLSGLPAEAFPLIQHPWKAAGGLNRLAAAALDLPLGTLVVTGLHDGAAASIGAGAVSPGDACLTLGTNYALRVVTGKRPKTKCFGYVVAPGQWAWVDSVAQAATQLDIVADALAELFVPLEKRHQHLGALAASVVPTNSLPTLTLGDSTMLPGLVAEAIRLGFSHGEIYRSVLSAAAAGVRDLVESARNDGASIKRYVATGGGVHNAELMRTLTETLGKPIELGHPEAGLLGAAMVAAIGAGWYPTLADTRNSMSYLPLTVFSH